MKSIWLTIPSLFLALAACDSGPDAPTGTTGPGSAGSSGAASGGTGGTGGSAGTGGGASAGAGGTASGGTTSPTLGVVCEDDTTCKDGLVCLPLSSGSGTDCKEIARACSKPCATNEECGKEGEALCVSDCGLEGKRCAKDGFSGKLGETCSDAKVCQTGLSCLPVVTSKGGGACETVGMACSKPCIDGMSCAELGPKAACLGCGEDRYCGLTK